MVRIIQTGTVKAAGDMSVGGDIVAGILLEGASNDEVIRAALETVSRINIGSTGDVTSGGRMEVRGDIVTGVSVRLHYLNPQAPDRESFVAELQSLRATLAELQKQPQAPAEVEAAAKSLDEAIGEAQKKEPLGKLVVRRLHDAVEFIADAGKLLETADRLAPLVGKAISTAVVLYQVAQALF